MRARCLGVLLGALALLSGCVVGPNYRRPAAPTPPAYRGQTAAESASIADLPWWSVFQDETLQELIRTAVANNRDLRVAVARVEEAHQLAIQAHSEFLPAVIYEGGLSGGQNESLGQPYAGSGTRQGTAVGLLEATWEADVWGRIRRSNEYALAVYLGSEQGRRGVLLSLMSSVATSYFELLELDLRLDIARRNVDSFQGSLDIFQQRLDGGTASRLETSRARAALEQTAANIPDLERQIVQKENEIAVLLGSLPGPITRKGRLLEQTMPPEVPAGVPSTLLERRPDVVQAELAVRAANARIGIATANFFPRIGLTTLFGRMSSPLEDFSAGRASLWSLAGIAGGPIWEGGTLRAQKRQAVAEWDEARAGYEQAALNAFRDVSNALIAREKLEAVRARQTEAVNAYHEAVEVSQQRYVAGKSSYFEVLEAQQELFPAENALAQTELDRRLTIIQLYQALGGGWNLTDAQWGVPPAGPVTTRQP
jgi:multidrug efflux system outer membrane protein